MTTRIEIFFSELRRSNFLKESKRVPIKGRWWRIKTVLKPQLPLPSDAALLWQDPQLTLHQLAKNLEQEHQKERQW